MAESFKVFVVDDDELMREMVSGLLSGDYLVEAFSGAPSCLARLAEQMPDIFLLDVEMPGMGGHALCKYLKNNEPTRDIPVVFVSAHDTAEARMTGYEAGGEDFICKPVDPDELISKLMVARRIVREKQALRSQANDAQRMAMAAMTGMSELGIILRFLSRTFACNTLPELAQATLEATEQYDLKAAVQLRADSCEISVSRNGTDVPLEVLVLNQVREFERIYQYKTRCVFNYGGVSLMINNMPKNDDELAGRLRDNLAILAEGAEARLRGIEIERKNERRQGTLRRALPQFHAAVGAMHDSYRHKNFQMTQLLTEYQDNLRRTAVGLGLTELQEDQLTLIALKFVEQMSAIQDETFAIVLDLQQLVETLSKVARD